MKIIFYLFSITFFLIFPRYHLSEMRETSSFKWESGVEKWNEIYSSSSFTTGEVAAASRDGWNDGARARVEVQKMCWREWNFFFRRCSSRRASSRGGRRKEVEILEKNIRWRRWDSCRGCAKRWRELEISQKQIFCLIDLEGGRLTTAARALTKWWTERKYYERTTTKWNRIITLRCTWTVQLFPYRFMMALLRIFSVFAIILRIFRIKICWNGKFSPPKRSCFADYSRETLCSCRSTLLAIHIR